MAVKEHVEKLNEGVEAWNEWRRQNQGVKPDLKGAKLPDKLAGIDLSDANLGASKLKGSDLSGAKLVRANLAKANLTMATLRRANLSRADLSGTDLHEADLSEADLTSTQLWSANLALTKLEKADLSGADLRRANVQAARLVGANLSEAKLEGADLEGAQMGRAKLSDANLTGATLRKADLTNALLAGAVLRGSVLQDANLSDVDGLRSEQLAGANLSGAKLPPAVEKFDALGMVDETSRNAKKLFTSLLLGCVYALLTVATTTDVRLVTNSASSPLPIIGTAIPIAVFYWAAPFILMCLYSYFLLYLQRLWEFLGHLPAMFPDGTPLDKKAYPWLVNGLIRSHVALLKQDRPEFSRSQTALSVFLAYWVVPLTLVFLWGRYLTRHEWIGTGFHVALLALSIVIAISLHGKAASTLRGAARQSVPWRKRLKQKGTYISAFATVVLLSGLIWRSELAISGQTVFFRADLAEQDVSTKPPTWTGQKEKEAEEIALVKPARLRGANLRGATVAFAFLVRADLRRADLSAADLLAADLRGANLRDADLDGAELSRADLRGANLTMASLIGAAFHRADLREADLSVANLFGASLNVADLRQADLRRSSLVAAHLNEADLREAVLYMANLHGADLSEADLFRADLLGAILTRADLSKANLQGAKGLSPDQVKSARNWEYAFYAEDFLQQLGLPPDHNEKVLEEIKNDSAHAEEAKTPSRSPTTETQSSESGTALSRSQAP